MGSAEESFLGFDRLVRFEDKEGCILYGDLPTDCRIEDAVGSKVTVLDGKPFDGLKKSQRVAEIKKVRRISSFPVCLGLAWSTQETVPYPLTF